MKKTYKKLCSVAGLMAAACFVQTALAAPPIPVGQTNYFWSGAGDGTSWSDAANWNWQSYDAATNQYNGSGVVPPANSTTYQEYLGTGDPTTSTSPITIGASDVVQTSDSMYGPEWGQTLNINGSVTIGFAMFPMGDTAGTTSTVNLYGSATLHALDTLAVGDAWWFPGGPNVAINVNDNSQVTANWIQFGGHLSISGNGMVTVYDGFNTGGPTTPVFTGGLDTDATRLIDISDLGKLVLPGDYTTQVNDWISRGIIEGNGVVGAVSLDLVSDPGNTIVMAVPEPVSMALLGLGGLALLLRRRLVS